MAHPNERVTKDANGVITYNDETNAQLHLGHLSPEVLRDLARNEAASKEWRKAAVEFLLLKQHAHANHPELRELVFEIRAEKAAKEEVLALAAHPENEHQEVLVNETTAVFQTKDPFQPIPPHSGVVKEVVNPENKENDLESEASDTSAPAKEIHPIQIQTRSKS